MPQNCTPSADTLSSNKAHYPTNSVAALSVRYRSNLWWKELGLHVQLSKLILLHDGALSIVFFVAYFKE